MDKLLRWRALRPRGPVPDPGRSACGSPCHRGTHSPRTGRTATSTSLDWPRTVQRTIASTWSPASVSSPISWRLSANARETAPGACQPLVAAEDGLAHGGELGRGLELGVLAEVLRQRPVRLRAVAGVDQDLDHVEVVLRHRGPSMSGLDRTPRHSMAPHMGSTPKRLVPACGAGPPVIPSGTWASSARRWRASR